MQSGGGGGGHVEGQQADFGLLCVLCCSGHQIPGHKPVLVCVFFGFAEELTLVKLILSHLLFEFEHFYFESTLLVVQCIRS